MRLLDPANPAAWLLGSLFAIVLATNLAWVLVRRKAADPDFRSGPLAAGGWLALGLFYLLVPFLALRRGVVSPYTLGLTEINWPATLSNGLILAATVVSLALFGWLLYRRSLPEAPASPPVARLIAALAGPATAVLEQWHWAFYRATAGAALLALPAASPAGYWAPRRRASGRPALLGRMARHRDRRDRMGAQPVRPGRAPGGGGSGRRNPPRRAGNRNDRAVCPDPQLLVVPRRAPRRGSARCDLVRAARAARAAARLNHKGPGSTMSRAFSCLSSDDSGEQDPQNDQP